MNGHRVFLSQFFRQYHTTGSILPSGRRLAKALCRFVPSGGGQRRILEVGPGTGPVTAQLVRRLGPDDQLCLVELNDTFVEHLRGLFSGDAAFQAAAARSELVHGRVEDLPGDGVYDVIISGLPLNNFAVAEVEAILGCFARLIRPGGILSFFEYIAIRSAKSIVSGARERTRLREIGRVLAGTLNGREVRRDWIWPNVPPAWVHHVRLRDT